jgi:hypothetical protein
MFHGFSFILGLFHGSGVGSGLFCCSGSSLLRLSVPSARLSAVGSGCFGAVSSAFGAVLAMPWLLSPVHRLAALGVACLAVARSLASLVGVLAVLA